MHNSLADRLKARADQIGITPAHVAELAGVNRSFVYDILRGRSTRPSIKRLADVARVLKVDRDWLLHGIGEVEGRPPLIENEDESFVAVARAGARPTSGSEAPADNPERAYHFRRSWIRQKLRASHSQLRIMLVQGDSMAPTLFDGDAVLVDLSQTTPAPPGIFVMDDGMGLVAKRLEHIPNSDPPAVRVISDNKLYPEHECTADDIKIVGRIRWFAREV